MLEYTYKERFCPTIRYSVSEDGKWLLVNGKNWGDRWQDFFWMAELNPDCSYVSVSGLKYKIAAICLGAVSFLFLLLTLLVWGEEHFSFRPESFSNCLFILNIALVFAIFATVMFFRWKKNHGTIPDTNHSTYVIPSTGAPALSPYWNTNTYIIISINKVLIICN